MTFERMNIRELKGADMDIDLLPDPTITWKKAACPWNQAEGKNTHKCAVKGASICKYFQGVKRLDTVLCSYPQK
jgi:hypothetical protein